MFKEGGVEVMQWNHALGPYLERSQNGSIIDRSSQVDSYHQQYYLDWNSQSTCAWEHVKDIIPEIQFAWTDI